MNKHEELSQLLAIYDDLNETEQAQIDAHVADCPECAASLAAYRAMDRRLQQLPRLQSDPSLRQDFYTQMESNMTSYKRNKQIRRLPAFAIQILVIGALILLGFAFWSNLRQEEVPLAAPSVPVTVESSTPLAIGDITFEERSYSPGETVTFLIFWHNVQTTGEEMISLRLMDFESGAPIAQRDEPLVISMGEQNMSIHELDLPAELNDGAYPLEISVYKQSTGERIPAPTETVIAPQPVIVGETVNVVQPTPVLETAVIRLESWSPDSQYLVLREFTEADLTNGAVGSLHVYDTNTGSFCTPGFDGQSWSNGRVWLDNHTLAYINARNEMAVGDACTPFDGFVDLGMSPVHGIMDQSHDHKTLLLHVDNRYLLYHLQDLSRPDITRLNLPEDLTITKGIFSPDDQHVALIDNVGTILFVNTSRGNVVQTIPWQLENQLPDPIWLGNDLLLARPLPLPEEHALITMPANPDPNAHTGSFIVDLDGNVTPLDNLFETEIDDTKQILTAPNLAENSYTILLASRAEVGEPTPVQVYNSATNEVETLLYTEIWQGGITEDGRYLLTAEVTGTDGDRWHNLLVREVTAVGEAFTQFLSTGSSEFPTSPDRELMGLSSAGLLYDTSSYPIITQANQWFDNLGFSNSKDILWSPDTQHVAVVGGIEGTNQSQLFIMDTKPSPLTSNQTTETFTPARVTNTRLEGLPLRTTPGGELIGTLSEGIPVSILADVPTQEQNNLTWQKIRTTGGVEGWVVAEFLALDLPEE